MPSSGFTAAKAAAPKLNVNANRREESLRKRFMPISTFEPMGEAAQDAPANKRHGEWEENHRAHRGQGAHAAGVAPGACRAGERGVGDEDGDGGEAGAQRGQWMCLHAPSEM